MPLQVHVLNFRELHTLNLHVNQKESPQIINLLTILHSAVHPAFRFIFRAEIGSSSEYVQGRHIIYEINLFYLDKF